MAEPVRIEFRNDIAIVWIDNPPVNVLSRSVRQGLLSATHTLGERRDIRAVIVAAADGSFVAGADLREMNEPAADPQLPDVYRAIEGSKAPWIAAIGGPALGGGLELALACRGRIALTKAVFGLPEVTLGIIPGSGGTVRLPRLIAADRAIDFVTSGKPITASVASGLGLVDAVTNGDLLEEALTFAAAFIDRPGLLSQPVVPPREPIDWADRRKTIAVQGRGQNSPLEALEAMHDSLTMEGGEALARERQRFLRLRASAEAAALRHIFFAEKNSAEPLRTIDASPVALDSCGVVGGGTMGAGIAAALLMSGSHVVLVEQDAARVQKGVSNVGSLLEGSYKRGILTQDAYDAAKSRLTATTDYAALSDRRLVIEAVFEDMQVKQQVFAALDAAVAPDAILGTNTSYLDVADLAARSAHPERVIGLHFFSPAHVMKLLEVVRPITTCDVALATANALAKRLRKIAVVAGVCDGFIGNRIMAAYRAECEMMLEEGALPENVDAAMRDFGFAMGIFETQDMSGLDIAWAMRKRRAAEGKSAGRSRIADRLCEKQRFGRKTGAGWYRYEGSSPEPDPVVAEIARQVSHDLGLERREIPDREIIDRILSAVKREGDMIVAEGIARNEADIDVVMINGYGFPRFRGGPMYHGALFDEAK